MPVPDIKVKICGITTATDARHALLCGADYLGFIFYPPSPRSTTTDSAKAIISELKTAADTGPLWAQFNPPLLIGVFVNESPLVIAKTLAFCGLDLAQLSGDETSQVATDPGSAVAGRAYQALRPQSAAGARTMAAAYTAPTAPDAPSLLLDTYHPALRGGTGEAADWGLAAELKQLTPRLMLAGGLTADNVADAVCIARPFAVDVASGVEASPGRKDPDKVRRFIAATREAT